MKRTSPTFLFDRMVAWSFDNPLQPAWQYVLAAASVTTIGILRALFITDALPWLLFIPTILAVALVTGSRPGMFAAALSTALGVASIGSAANPTWLPANQWIASGLFLLVGSAMVLLTAELRSSMRRARALNVELVERERSSAEREAFLQSVLAASTDCIKVVDLDGRLEFMSDGGMRTMEIGDFDAVKGCPWPDLMKEDGPQLASEALAAAREGRSSHFEAPADTLAGNAKFWSVSVSPIRDERGRVARILSVSRDHTALEEARAHQRLLNGELGHRLKNVLTVVQAVANQTLRDADSVEAASAAFSSRLASLGRATEALTSTVWREADLREVVDAGLSAVEGVRSRITIEGPEIRLNSQASLALTLALHELTTNAVKYGSLSNETGTVRLIWNVATVGHVDRFSLLWQERGGPPVAKPSRKGFGSRMIERSLRSYFRGDIALNYPPEGVEFRIEAPLSGAGELVAG